MAGFMFGAACLFGLYWYLSREQEDDSPTPTHRRRSHRRQRWVRKHLLRRLYHSLDTSPHQEAVIEHTVWELQQRGETLRNSVSAGRKQLGDALRADVLDQPALERWADSQNESLSKVRAEVLAGLAKVHEVLDPRQRARLADILTDDSCRHQRCRSRLGFRRFA